MVRNYRKKVGGRPYRRYSEESLAAAVDAVKAGMSQKAASLQFKVPRTTIVDKVNENHPMKHGHPTVLSKEDEQLIAETLGVVSDWGFPLTPKDLAGVISGFVRRQGREVRQWKNNVPGYDFIKSFAKRNNLSNRLATNIKQQRAAVGRHQISEFFKNIEPHLKNVLPSNIFNYDETNVTDDPGAKKVLVPRGRKRVERIKEHSRTSISLMICGNAEGQLLPPMVVYKSENLYENWCEGGPTGTIYGCSKSGWFDMVQFEKWFFDCLLPYLQNNSRSEDPKILIGDNLASHFSPAVISSALENNIYMTPLPANSTHLMQPLDVSFFGPMKKKWRNILDCWRKESRRRGSIPKQQFPGLLKNLWTDLLRTSEANLKAGFRTTGMVPFDPDKIINKLPTIEESSSSERLLDSSLLEFFQESRGYKKTAEDTRFTRRGKKLPIKPGCQMIPAQKDQLAVHITAEDDNEISTNQQGRTATDNILDNRSDTELPKTAPPTKKFKKTAKTVKTRSRQTTAKNKPENILDKPGPSKENTSNDDGICSVCCCDFKTYRYKKDWICCVTCLRWVCGKCNEGSLDPNYKCPECNKCSICLVEFHHYNSRLPWICCVACNKWICGLCNGGSKNPRYECPDCEDSD